MFSDLKVAFFLALRMLKRSSRAGTILTILIMAMVFTNMIFMSSIISGSIQLFNQQTVDYYVSDIVVSPSGDDRYIENAKSLLHKINRVRGVKRASARYALGGSISHKSKEISMPILAIEPEDEIETMKIASRMKAGEYLSRGDTGQILIGNFVAGNVDESLDLFESLGGVRVGDRINVSYVNGVSKSYRIKGIFQTKSYQVDYMVFITNDEMERVLGRPLDQATEILVKTQPESDIKQVKTELLQNGISEKVKTWREKTGKAVSEAIESFDIINDITLIVSLIIAVIVLFIVIMIKTLHQRKEIGILKAIGIDREIIIASYMIQTMAIAITGIGIGYCIVYGLSAWFTLHPIEFPDGNVSPFIDGALLIESSVLLLIASAIAGYIPAWRIVREDILNSIRRV